MISSVHPIVWIAVIATAVAVASVTLAFRVRRLVFRIVLALVALVCLLPAAAVAAAFYPELVDARFRVYKDFYSEIQEGMSRDEVFALMEHHYPASGPRLRPKVLSDEADKIGFFMNPETSREPNCEGIFLRLAQGRVVERSYSAD